MPTLFYTCWIVKHFYSWGGCIKLNSMYSMCVCRWISADSGVRVKVPASEPVCVCVCVLQTHNMWFLSVCIVHIVHSVCHHYKRWWPHALCVYLHLMLARLCSLKVFTVTTSYSYSNSLDTHHWLLLLLLLHRNATTAVMHCSKLDSANM